MLLNTADAVLLGDTPAQAVYLGATKVWSSVPPGPTTYRVLDPPYNTSTVFAPLQEVGACRIQGNAVAHRWAVNVKPLPGTETIDWTTLPLGSVLKAIGATSGAVAEGRVVTLSTMGGASSGVKTVTLDIRQVAGFLAGEDVVFESSPQPVMPPPTYQYIWGAGTGNSQVPEAGHVVWFNTRREMCFASVDASGAAANFPVGATVEMRRADDPIEALAYDIYVIDAVTVTTDGLSYKTTASPQLEAPASAPGNDERVNVWITPPTTYTWIGNSGSVTVAPTGEVQGYNNTGAVFSVGGPLAGPPLDLSTAAIGRTLTITGVTSGATVQSVVTGVNTAGNRPRLVLTGSAFSGNQLVAGEPVRVTLT